VPLPSLGPRAQGAYAPDRQSAPGRECPEQQPAASRPGGDVTDQRPDDGANGAVADSAEDGQPRHHLHAVDPSGPGRRGGVARRAPRGSRHFGPRTMPWRTEPISIAAVPSWSAPINPRCSRPRRRAGRPASPPATDPWQRLALRRGQPTTPGSATGGRRPPWRSLKISTRRHAKRRRTHSRRRTPAGLPAG
jgi:hypothetical protein